MRPSKIKGGGLLGSLRELQAFPAFDQYLSNGSFHTLPVILSGDGSNHLVEPEVSYKLLVQASNSLSLAQLVQMQVVSKAILLRLLGLQDLFNPTGFRQHVG